MARTSRIQKGISETNDRQHGSSYIPQTGAKQIFSNIVRNASVTCAWIVETEGRTSVTNPRTAPKNQARCSIHSERFPRRYYSPYDIFYSKCVLLFVRFPTINVALCIDKEEEKKELIKEKEEKRTGKERSRNNRLPNGVASERVEVEEAWIRVRLIRGWCGVNRRVHTRRVSKPAGCVTVRRDVARFETIHARRVIWKSQGGCH